jgi:hypothetical protein
MERILSTFGHDELITLIRPEALHELTNDGMLTNSRRLIVEEKENARVFHGLSEQSIFALRSAFRRDCLSLQPLQQKRCLKCPTGSGREYSVGNRPGPKGAEEKDLATEGL